MQNEEGEAGSGLEGDCNTATPFEFSGHATILQLGGTKFALNRRVSAFKSSGGHVSVTRMKVWIRTFHRRALS